MTLSTPESAAKRSRFRGISGAAGDGSSIPKWLTVGTALAAVAYLTLTPVIFLIYRMFTDRDGVATIDNVTQAYTDSTIIDLTWTTLVFVLGSTIVGMGTGTLLAYLHARTNIRFKRSLLVLSLGPLILPGLLYTTSWILLASPRSGILNLTAFNLFGVRPFDIFTMPGMIWVEGVSLSPLCYLLMLAAFQSMDHTLEEAAFSCGAKLPRVLFKVTFPMMKPAFFAATLLTVVRTLEGFEVPALIGIPGGIWVFASRIWDEVTGYPPNIGVACAYGSMVMLIAIALVTLQRYYVKQGGEKAVQTIGGKGFAARPRELSRRARILTETFVVFFLFATILLPTASLLYSSLLPLNMVPSKAAFASMSFDNFTAVVSRETVQQGTINSLILAPASATIVMALVSIAAWVVVRTRAHGRGAFDVLTTLPIAVPGIALGLSILVVYLRVPLPIYGTLLILLVAYITKFLPFGMRFATTSMYQVHSDLEESALVSGASWMYTFRRVLLPLIAPGIIAGWIYVAMVSVRELSSSVLIYSPGSEVIGVAMWQLSVDTKYNQLAALGIIMIVVLALLAAIAQRARRNAGSGFERGAGI